MYTLSRIGDAGFGGGENGLTVATELNKTLYDYGRHVEIFASLAPRLHRAAALQSTTASRSSGW